MKNKCDSKDSLIWTDLLHIFRGQIGEKSLLEATHQGAIAVVDGEGHLLCSLGDIKFLTHLRSTAKPFQLLPFMVRELDVKAGLDDAELALLMGSHAGEDIHIARLKSAMQKLGVHAEELLCGIHAPTSQTAKHALIKSGKEPSVIHNNCSGKHCAFVAVSKASGWEISAYLDVSHPLQREIVDVLSELSGIARDAIGVGIDGCSAPTFVMPLVAMAGLYAKLAYPQNAPGFESALAKLFRAATQHPDMIAGTNRLDTLIMRAGKGEIFAKTGAEGAYALAIAPNAQYPNGLGIAIKIADGDSNHRARNRVVVELLLQLGILSAADIEAEPKLSHLASSVVKNLRDLEVGRIESVFKIDVLH